MCSLDGHSDHGLRQCCMGKIISSWTFFDLSGRGILYFGSATVVEFFQPIRSSIGLGLRVGPVSALDLAQTRREVSTRERKHVSRNMARNWPAAVARDE